uniref:Uncharacterized protein n=1 Tax=Ditylenchus dipsaci TaxID=166011 RepID=A0A915CKX9_9BILA
MHCVKARTRYRCNTWQKTNCTYQICSNVHNHEQDLSTAPTDNYLRRNQLYNSSASAMDGGDQDEKMLARQLLQRYSIDQKLISASTNEFLKQSSSASSPFNLTERKGELGVVAKKLSLDISSDGDMYMFFSKDPSMAGHWLELEEKADTVLVSEFHQCKPVGEKCWQKADWDQFICAVRGKCVDYFFGDTDGCEIIKMRSTNTDII